MFFYFVVVGWFQFLSVSFNLIGVCKLTTRLRWLRKHFCFKIRYSDIEFIHTYQKNIVLYTFTYTLTYSTYIYTHTNIVGVFVYILFVFSLINLCYLFRFFYRATFFYPWRPKEVKFTLSRVGLLALPSIVVFRNFGAQCLEESLYSLTDSQLYIIFISGWILLVSFWQWQTWQMLSISASSRVYGFI